MSEQRYDGSKGINIGQGQKMEMKEGELVGAKFESFAFMPKGIAFLGDKVKMIGAEKVDGKDYYAVKAKLSDASYMLYFDAKTYLLSRMDVTSGEGEKAQTTTLKFSDYTKKDGVMLPGKYTLSGVMPMDLNFSLDKVEINGKIDDSWFSVQ